MSFLRELIHFFRFFWGTRRSEKQIVCYAEHEGYFPNFEGLLEELIHKRGLAVCYVTSDPRDPVLKRRERLLRTFYLRRLLAFWMVLVKCRVFVMTLTDLNRYHLKRSAREGVHYLYLFHSLVSTHMMYRKHAFDHYDTILCVGPHQTDEIRAFERQHDLKPKQLVEAGYYRLERIQRAHRERPDRAPATSDKPLVLVAPSWGEKNVLESCGLELVRLLLDSNFRVIVRPHPETVRRSPGLIRRLEQEFGGRPELRLEKSVAGDESLLEADVLISDCSGVTLEYAFGTLRPVLFLDVPPKVQNPDYRELNIEPLELRLRPSMGTVVSPGELDRVPAVVGKMIAGRDEYSERLSSLRDEWVFSFGRSSEIGADVIVGLLSEHPGGDRKTD